MAIHLGKTRSREGWLSFETDEHLTRTKRRLHERCLPCLMGLYEQLKAGATQIELREAWTCWKVTAVVDDDEECLEVLRRFGERYPEEAVYGKIGGGVGRETSAVIFHTETEERRDRLAAMLSDVLREHFPSRRAVVSRGCGNPYETLLGPWPAWLPLSPVRWPERSLGVRTALRDSLYRR
ncbi:MAG: hypothetical protein HZB55_12570 [Deltaproteobacteria bacterium]|nr:hypothetical protein [Deltaproteobacteria bacterium]